MGNLDIRGMFQSFSKKDYTTYCMYYLSEKSRKEMRERNEKNGTNVSYMTFVGDMAGASIRSMFYKPCKTSNFQKKLSVRPFSLISKFVANLRCRSRA